MQDTTGRPHVALIQFPGSNCEWETQRAAEADGADVIMAVSVEAAERGQVSAAPSSQDTIFRGGFGS